MTEESLGFSADYSKRRLTRRVTSHSGIIRSPSLSVKDGINGRKGDCPL